MLGRRGLEGMGLGDGDGWGGWLGGDGCLRIKVIRWGGWKRMWRVREGDLSQRWVDRLVGG